MPFQNFILCWRVNLLFFIKISCQLTCPSAFIKQIYYFWCSIVQKGNFTFFSRVYSIIPPFFLKWQNQIFLPLSFDSFLLCQMGPRSLATLKTCHGIIGYMEERGFSKKHNTSHTELGESPGSLRHMKQLSLSVSVLQARGSCCATRLPGDCKADSTSLSKHSFH